MDADLVQRCTLHGNARHCHARYCPRHANAMCWMAGGFYDKQREDGERETGGDGEVVDS